MENKKQKAKKQVKKPAKKPAKRGAPSKFTEELFSKILRELSFSDNSIVNICKSNNISADAFFDWLIKYENLSQRYTRARERQADFLADQIIEIANEKSGDIVKIMKDGKLIEVEDKEFVSRSKLKIEARKWIASKLKPKKYSERIEVDQKTEVSGEINHVITGMIIVDEEEKTEENEKI
jgi:hypothetical protein